MATKKKTWSVAEAKNELPRLLRQAESGEPVVLTRHGREVAAIVSIETYRSLEKPRPDFWDVVQEVRRRHDFEALQIDVDEVFDSGRDRSLGKDVSW